MNTLVTGYDCEVNTLSNTTTLAVRLIIWQGMINMLTGKDICSNNESFITNGTWLNPSVHRLNCLKITRKRCPGGHGAVDGVPLLSSPVDLIILWLMLIVMTALLSAVLRCSAFRSRSSYKRRTNTAEEVIGEQLHTHSAPRNTKTTSSRVPLNAPTAKTKCHTSNTSSREVYMKPIMLHDTWSINSWSKRGYNLD